MKKRVIYNEFQRIAKEVVGECRKAQKYYVMQMCEQLGKVDHKQPFVLWCSKKRVLAYQSGMWRIEGIYNERYIVNSNQFYLGKKIPLDSMPKPFQICAERLQKAWHDAITQNTDAAWEKWK